MEQYEDPASPLNGMAYRSGRECIEGCGREAGTAWSPHWCQPCNAKRMNRLSAGFAKVEEFAVRGEGEPHGD